ncbi:MAG: GNAT family N-acetyltransferase, partial [Tepidisphaeraceae bacterium]
MSRTALRNYGGEVDLPAIAALINRCAAADPFETGTCVEELRSEYSDPLTDPGRDVMLAEQGGDLIGVGELWRPAAEDHVEAHLMMRVHPDVDAANIDPMLLEWAGRRVRELSRQRGLPGRLGTTTKERDASRARLLESRGFAVERYFLRMRRDLTQPLDPPSLPPGFALRSIGGVEEAQLWVDLFNDSFVDHWNFHPSKVERHEHFVRTDPNYQSDGDLVAIAPDGTPAAFCLALI